jgi:Pentapeptide repeats (8 copies)
MANEEHLAKLKEGVEAWNQWRKKNPGLQPDLQGAFLSQAQLQGVNLIGAQLQGANLIFAQLQGAILQSAQLQRAGLGHAQLEGALLRESQLQGALLFSAQLQGADLREAQLQGANLQLAQLQGADLHGAFFDNTTNLKEVVLGEDKYGFALLADVSWGGVNLAVADWSPLKMLGDEYEARRSTINNKYIKDEARRLEDYRTAVRANRQLAVVLRDQGLNEEAERLCSLAVPRCARGLWVSSCENSVLVSFRDL